MHNKLMNAMRGLNTLAAKIAVSLTIGTSATLAIAGTASAYVPPNTSRLDTLFTESQANVLHELGLGATLLIAITLFVVGIWILVRWARRALMSSEMGGRIDF